jgi:hypothetical protein
MLVGLANGLLLAEPLGADGSEPFQVAAIGGLALGGATGLLYGDRVQPTRGQMSFVGTLATLGFATAGLGLVVTAPDIEADTVLITMAAGIDLGAAAGLVLGRDLTWSSGGPAWCGSAPWSVASVGWAARSWSPATRSGDAAPPAPPWPAPGAASPSRPT